MFLESDRLAARFAGAPARRCPSGGVYPISTCELAAKGPISNKPSQFFQSDLARLMPSEIGHLLQPCGCRTYDSKDRERSLLVGDQLHPEA